MRTPVQERRAPLIVRGYYAIRVVIDKGINLATTVQAAGRASPGRPRPNRVSESNSKFLVLDASPWSTSTTVVVIATVVQRY
jgi:hypothetical protein